MSSKKSRPKNNAYLFEQDKYKYTAQQTADLSIAPIVAESRRQLPTKSNVLAAAYQPDEHIQTPKSLTNSYRFIKEIGHGHQAHVYLAIQKSINQPVAIKQLNIDSVKAWKEYELFHREAKILSNLNIPGVARFYDAIECLEDDPPCSYIIQEYIEGTPLSQMLKDGHRFQTSEVYDILLQMLKILKQLQSMEPPVIHRDIKPSNMMISKDSANKYKVTLIDFGAVANPQVQSGGSTVAGTYGYMPPEQLMGRPVPASDIYSLGAVAVELFSGISPAQLPVKDFRLIFEPEVQQLPVAVVNTLRSMLEPKAEERPSDIDKLIEAFQKYKSQQFDVDLYKAQNIDRDRAINRKLREVTTICEPGNMDLWQHLSDKTPRNVPGYYLDRLKEEKNALDKIVARPEDKAKKCWIYAIIFLFLSMLLPSKLGIPGFIIPFIVSVFFLLLALIHSSSTPNSPDLSYCSEEINKMNARLLDLIQNGRKTVATLTDVSYMPIRGNNTVTDNHDLKVVNGLPSFLVRYRFNPPDDAREEDLVHAFVSHSDPEGLLKPGDPLPILYMIEESAYQDRVSSMPYPYPAEDAISPEVVFMSESRPRFTYYKSLGGNGDAEVPAEVTKRTDYRMYYQPMINASKRKNNVRLMECIRSIWTIKDYEVTNLVLKFAETIFESDNVQMHVTMVESLLRMTLFSNIKSRTLVSSFLAKYFASGLPDVKEYIAVIRFASGPAADSQLSDSIWDAYISGFKKLDKTRIANHFTELNAELSSRNSQVPYRVLFILRSLI